MSETKKIASKDTKSTKEVKKTKSYVILDVRAVERFEAGTLPGAVNVPLFTVNEENKNI